jgi:hypothetical protein
MNKPLGDECSKVTTETGLVELGTTPRLVTVPSVARFQS